jgi:hypothetical protein
MSSIVYLLRSPVEQLSSALYSAGSREAVVVRLRSSGSASSKDLAEVLEPGGTSSLVQGQRLSGGQLLELLLHAPKVITL